MFSKIISYFAKNKLLVLLAFIYFILQILFLDQLNLLRGERDIALTGYSLAKTGADIYGRFMPTDFIDLDMPTPMLAFYYSALWWIFMPFKSIFFARLPFVVSSLALIFLTYEIILQITKNKRLSLVTSIIFCFSPGVFHLVRLSLEIGFATPVLFTGILLYLKEKRWWAFGLFLISYFTYNGFRPIIPFLLVYLEFFLYLKDKNLKQFFKYSLVGAVFFIITFAASATFIDGRMMASRKEDLVFVGYNEITPKVDLRREASIGPEIAKKIFNNKITATVYYMIEVFIKGQDISYLFLKGDYAAIYATTFTGQFFLIGLLFYYLGFFYLGKKWERNYFYVLGFIPVALVSSVINIDYISIAIRSILSSVSYAFIVAGGVVLGLEIIRKLRFYWKALIICSVALFFSVELTYFVYNYYFRRPRTMSESYFENERQIANYLINTKKKYIIYDDSPRNIYATYIFLKRDSDIIEAQKQFIKGAPYTLNGSVIYECPKQLQIKRGMIIAESCLNLEEYQKINDNPKIERIPYQDFSRRNAYFIIE